MLIFCAKKVCWMDGWMGGWMDGWVGGRGGLRIASSNKKYRTLSKGGVISKS